jgi:Na+/melibiose symporter-like transporter
VGLIIGLIPAIIITRRRRPEELGLTLDGEPLETGSAGDAKSAAAASGSEDWTAREAIHSREFWMVAAGMSLILLAPNVSIIFMFSYLTSKGIDPGAAAVAVGAVSAMQVISRLVFWSPVTGRMHSVRWALVLWGGLLLAATLLLAFAENQVMAYLAAGVLGLGLGGNLVLQLQVWPEYFGRKSIGTIIGTSQLLQGFNSAVVPLALAALLDHSGSYSLLYLIVSCLVLSGLCLHILVGKPQRRVQPADL